MRAGLFECETLACQLHVNIFAFSSLKRRVDGRGREGQGEFPVWKKNVTTAGRRTIVKYGSQLRKWCKMSCVNNEKGKGIMVSVLY